MNAMNLMNCTPHAIVVRHPVAGPMVFEPSGTIPRVEMATRAERDYFGFVVVAREPGAVTGLPVNGEGNVVPCIVSGMVLDALQGRSALVGVVFAPDTGSTAIRDVKGYVVAVTQLVTVHA